MEGILMKRGLEGRVVVSVEQELDTRNINSFRTYIFESSLLSFRRTNTLVYKIWIIGERIKIKLSKSNFSTVEMLNA